MKKIGFIEYYLSEFHANKYPDWIAEANKKLGTDYVVAYAWAEEYVSPVDGVNTDEWCEKYGVERCATIEEVCEKSDVLLVLAPSNPEKHLPYAKVVLPYGKTTYIDKPFADTVENANEIFAIAKKYGTPFFSSSALRYAPELNEVGPCTGIVTVGNGSNLPEYIIHQAEMVVKKLGLGATAVKAQHIGPSQCTLTVKYDDDRRAGMHFIIGPGPYAATMQPKGCPDATYTNLGATFPNLIADILRFYETGEHSFDPAETLEVNKITVASCKAYRAPDEWIAV